MRRYGVLALVLAVAGCGWFAGNGGNTPEAQCQRQAYDDPAVKKLTVQGLNQAGVDQDADFAYTKALHDATDRCLQQKGVQVRGGVEPVRTQ